MPSKKYRDVLYFLIGSALLGTLLLFGCYGEAGEDGIQGPAGPTLASITGTVTINNGELLATGKTAADDETYRAAVAINNVSNIPDIKINDFDIPINDVVFYETGRMEGYGYNMPYPSDDSARLSVSYTLNDGEAGLAEAVVAFPEELFISDYNTMHHSIDSSIFIAWPVNDTADAYYLYVNLSYSWRDTAETLFTNTLIYDTLVRDKRHDIDKYDLFPDPSDVADTGFVFSGYISLYSLKGPIFAGSESNMTGDAIGFFCAVRDAGTIYFPNPSDIRNKVSFPISANSEEPNIPAMLQEKLLKINIR
ncbi:MAG: hypothetical protein ABIJ45_03685 [Candidatus Zixiibacteriota bacterium]